MHSKLGKDVRGNEKTEMIYFCAKEYRLAYQVVDVVNCDVLAVGNLFLSALGGYPGTYQIKLMES